MNEFDIIMKDAERATGRKFRFVKTPGAKGGELLMDENGGERTVVYGSKNEAKTFLNGVAWAMRLMDGDFKQKIYDEVQRQNDLEDIKSAAEVMGIELTEEQAVEAADYYDAHFNSEIGNFFQWQTAVEEVTKTA